MAMWRILSGGKKSLKMPHFCSFYCFSHFWTMALPWPLISVCSGFLTVTHSLPTVLSELGYGLEMIPRGLILWVSSLDRTKAPSGESGCRSGSWGCCRWRELQPWGGGVNCLGAVVFGWWWGARFKAGSRSRYNLEQAQGGWCECVRSPVSVYELPGRRHGEAL